MRYARFGIGLASLAAVTLLGTLVLASTLLPVLLGLDRLVLVSGSMSPSLLAGDVILVDRSADQTPVPGAVVVFSDPNNRGGVVTHRIVRVLPDGMYQTQGDANTVPDGTPVTQEMLRGRGAVLVPWVGYPSVMMQRGDGAQAVLVLFAGFALVCLARYGLLARHDPWSAAGPARPRGRRTPGLVVAASLATLLGVGAMWVPPQVSRAAYTATTANTGSLLERAGGLTYYLRSSGTGNRPSSATLPLTAAAPTQTTLFNYDTDRNGSPGLTISKGIGVSETDATKIQQWNLNVASDLTLSGTAQLTVWSAMKDFDTTKAGAVAAGIYECNPTGRGCTPLGTAPVLSSAPWSTVAGGWASKTWTFGPVSRTIAAGRVLQVRLAVTGSSGDDVMFAYDTTTYRSALSVG